MNKKTNKGNVMSIADERSTRERGTVYGNVKGSCSIKFFEFYVMLLFDWIVHRCVNRFNEIHVSLKSFLIYWHRLTSYEPKLLQ